MFDINVNRVLSNNLIKETKEKFNKEYKFEFDPNAFYVAIVEDTNDPYKLGRVRIRIPAVHGTNNSQSYFLSNNSLPWARPAILNGAGNDTGQFIIPATGTRVLVTFEYNDPSKPLYFGGIPTLINNKKYYNDNPNIYYGSDIEISTDDRITDLDESSAQQVIYKSFKGSTIIVDDKDGKESIKIIDAAGQQIIMENNSEDSLPRRQDRTNPPSTANIKVKTNGRLELDCDDFNINASNTNIQDYVQLEGTGDKNYVHSQLLASNTWRIEHNLKKFPSVTIFDSSGEEVYGDIQYETNDVVVINFNGEIAGKAYLN